MALANLRFGIQKGVDEEDAEQQSIQPQSLNISTVVEAGGT
jgi:hypothetical protein